MPDPSSRPSATTDYRGLAQASQTILLSYWLAPRRSYLWVVTPGKVAQFELPPQDQIEMLVRSYNRSIGQLRDPASEGNENGRKLYTLLLAPAQAMVPTGSRVAIAPDGELHNLNFETLPAGAASHYWIEDVRVSVIPSLDLASHRSRAPQSHGSALLLIGDPLPADAKNFPRLAEAGREIESIRKQFADITLRTGADATPGAYAASKPDHFSLIHFTAHAEANEDDPLDSAIILSPSPQAEAYKLYAREVVGLPIHADLVTISACRGAAGRTFAGEGLVGFAWSFLRAGARNVIAGLWEVDDRSTAELMDALYAGLRQGMSPPQALRQAQLTLLRSQSPHRKPYYWAPFQVISDALAN
jgi:CHAT domain-containing protein